LPDALGESWAKGQCKALEFDEALFEFKIRRCAEVDVRLDCYGFCHDPSSALGAAVWL